MQMTESMAGGVTLGIALFGAALGVINTFWQVYRDRVRLGVAAMWMGPRASVRGLQAQLGVVSEFADGVDRHPAGLFGVRVTNYGFIDVTIDSVGISRTGWPQRHFRRHRSIAPITSDAMHAVELPFRLGPRQSITVWCGLQGADLDASLKGVRRVYANTACGLDVYGTSALLRRLVRRAARRKDG